MTHQEHIQNYLMEKRSVNDGWIFKGEIERHLNTLTGSLSETAARRLRELVEAKRIEKAQAKTIDGKFTLLEKGGHSVYRHKVIEIPRVEEQLNVSVRSLF